MLYWGLAGKVLLEHLRGTPFLPWVLRLFGVKTGAVEIDDREAEAAGDARREHVLVAQVRDPDAAAVHLREEAAQVAGEGPPVAPLDPGQEDVERFRLVAIVVVPATDDGDARRTLLREPQP